MARQATGTVVEHAGADGLVYRSLRFSAFGKRRHLALGAVSREIAERELRGVLADVERAIWKAPNPPAPELARTATFHELCEQWWVLNEAQLAPSTRADYRWRLEGHLIPYFGDYPIDRITFDHVERYIAAKLAEREPLSPRSINMGLTLMAAILKGDVERELIARNPAKGKRKRAREREPRRTHLDTAEHIAALLLAAGELDARARRARTGSTSSAGRSYPRSYSPGCE